jgi:predicted anti-sigma-YlaC factor YlaD
VLTCRDLIELATDYNEGRMSMLERIRFDMHVLMCRNCRAWVRQLKETVNVLGALPDEPIPPELEADLLAAFRNWKAPS